LSSIDQNQYSEISAGQEQGKAHEMCMPFERSAKHLSSELKQCFAKVKARMQLENAWEDVRGMILEVFSFQLSPLFDSPWEQDLLNAFQSKIVYVGFF
jgi:hypothetical protein